MKHYEDLYEFDLETAITEYFQALGIEANIQVDFWKDDPDYPDIEFQVNWAEDNEDHWFYVRNAQNYTNEQLFDMWVKEREALHAEYLEWLTTAE